MSRGKLTVRIAVVLFGLMTLGGAWLVSIDGSSQRDPGPSQIGQDDAAPTGPILEADGIPEIPKLSDGQRVDARRILASDPYVRRLTRDVAFTVGRPYVWTRSNQELLGAAVDVKLATPSSYPVITWPRLANTEVLFEEDPDLVQPGIRPESGEFEASATGVESFTAFADLESEGVVWIVPMGRRVNFEPLNRERFPGPHSGD